MYISEVAGNIQPTFIHNLSSNQQIARDSYTLSPVKVAAVLPLQDGKALGQRGSRWLIRYAVARPFVIANVPDGPTTISLADLEEAAVTGTC